MDLLRPILFPNNYGTYTTTWTTTNSDGSVETDSGIVIVSTDSAGSLFTTTSEFPNLTTYTTTWTTTNSDGSVETDSGIVIVSTDSAGSLFTTTSEFPNNYGSSSAYLPLTTYTTTWTTTNSDGSVETDSGIVIVSTDSAGSLFTTTSEFPNNYGSSSAYLPLTTYTTTGRPLIVMDLLRPILVL
ncbi:CIC11C00000005881 [Sungouiella intermedia]|uniref:CIC11C00000005881 n=1 Tax=Sungouiella intermedia TaxID=45354 RepID=A0A1L0DMW0_9ASCO|nr:CIC11C00000005881 [[Candida] intermedia]